MKKFFTSIEGIVVSLLVLGGMVYVGGVAWRKSQEKKPTATTPAATTPTA